jgi:hypothetical protein
LTVARQGLILAISYRRKSIHDGAPLYHNRNQFTNCRNYGTNGLKNQLIEVLSKRLQQKTIELTTRLH